MDMGCDLQVTKPLPVKKSCQKICLFGKFLGGPLKVYWMKNLKITEREDTLVFRENISSYEI